MGSAARGSQRRPRSGPGLRRDQTQQRAVAPSLVGVGALAADFYVRTGYMPLPHAGMQPKRRRVRFDEADIQALVAYVASLGPAPPCRSRTPSAAASPRACASSPTTAPAATRSWPKAATSPARVPPPLEDATATQVAEAVRIGPYVMPRFPKAISDPELDSIVAYVQYAKSPDDRGGWALGHLGPVPEGMVTWLIAARRSSPCASSSAGG